VAWSQRAKMKSVGGTQANTTRWRSSNVKLGKIGINGFSVGLLL